MKLAIVAGLGLTVSACLGSSSSVSTPPKLDPRAQRLDRHVPRLLREFKAAGAGQILALIGDQPEIAAYYRQLVKKFYKVTLPKIL
jgi:hypothetical protein